MDNQFKAAMWPARKVALVFLHETCGDDDFNSMVARALREFTQRPKDTVGDQFVATNGVVITGVTLQEWPAP